MKYDREIKKNASDILNSKNIIKQKKYLQHGATSIYKHSYMVTNLCLQISDKLNININRKALIRGALLHDYFLYDWHIKDKNHRLHGFTHAKTAARNAKRDFDINEIEYNMIICHMFPLNLRIPKYKESVILTISDKICASYEIYININIINILKKFIYNNKLMYIRYDIIIICLYTIFIN